MRVVDTPITELGFAGVGVGAAMAGLRPDHRVHDLELRAPRARPGGERRRQDALHVGRTVPDADGLPRPQRRRVAAVGAAFAGVGVVARPHPRPQGHHARPRRTTPRGCSRRDPRRQPGVVLEGRDALQHQGRSARRRGLHRPARQGRAQARGRPLHAHHARQDRCSSRCRRPTRLAKEGISIDVVDLRTIRPMDVEAIAESVRKTNRAVVLEEGWEVCGVGAQVVDYIQRDCFDHLDAPVLRVHQEDVPMPYAKNLGARRQAGRGQDDRGRPAGHVPPHRLTTSPWQPRSSWRRSPRRWKRGASSSG